MTQSRIPPRPNNDRLQIRPREPLTAQIADAQSKLDQVILDGLAELVQEVVEAKDSPRLMDPAATIPS